MLLDKLAEEGQVGEVEFGADLLDRLVAVAQLLADSTHSGLVYQVKGGTVRKVLPRSPSISLATAASR